MSGYPTKRQNLTQHNQQQPLLPGLPDDIAQLCISNLHPSILFNVCRSWRRLIYSSSFPPFLALYTLLSSNSSDQTLTKKTVHLFTFDPISSSWEPLPSPPPETPMELLLLHHPSFLSRLLPIQSVSVSGKLILLAATDQNFLPALTQPLIFNPTVRNWIFGPPLVHPRRWCAAGSLRNVVYVASGIGSHYSIDVARSMEKWDLQYRNEHVNSSRFGHNNYSDEGWRWEKMKGLKSGRFSRDAIDAVGWRGKICMVNVRGDAPKDGVVYDVDKNTWEDMSEGMIKGWRGPVAAMDEEVMYVVDETEGSLRKYDQEMDSWAEIFKSDMLVGAQQIAAGGGRVCVVGDGGGGGIVVVDVVAAPPRLWVLETPPGFQALRVHILPRMSQPATDS